MKKFLAVIVSLVFCFGAAACAFAEEAMVFETDKVFEEPMAAQKKAAEEEADETRSGSSKLTTGDLIHFIPVTMEVSSKKVSVSGYFVNLNSDKAVEDFRDFEMDVYLEGKLLSSGDFGDLSDFTINPFGVKYFTFNYNGKHSLKNGNYKCNDRTYCVISCTFTSYDR